MYKLSVPIKSATVTAANRKIYLEQCKNAGVERVFLALGTPIYPIPKHIIENVTAFRSEGFEVGVWINTLGHGEVLSHVVSNDILPEFSQIVNIQGEQLQHANCPLDSKFCKFISKYIADLAKTGTNIVMLDDDFRMSFRGAEIACACPMHLIRIGEILGEDITLEQLRPYVLSGKANKYRDAWLKVQEEGLLTLAEEIRAEVDKESPHVNICVCSSVTGWNVDNMDFNKLIHILAGKNKPIFRLTGAPYWASLKGRFSLISTIETSRTIASFCKDTDIELMAEGDVYPRPRYTSPASHLELFDGVMLGDKSADGILKYMFDYVAGPKFETGYLKLHNDNKDFRKNISEWFKDGANAGVKIITHPHTMKNADLDLSTLAIWSPVPYDGTMISSCGIPTVYRTDGICNSVFGENARSYDLSELKKGTILDAVSAVILSERGVDVGLKNFDKLFDKELSFICTNDPEYRSFISNGKVRFLPTELCDSATPVLYFSEPHKKNITA